MPRIQATPQRGFTLIELMVVLVILGLLASLGWSSYQQHITRSRRAEGRAAIMQVLLQQERLHARDHTYRIFTPATNDDDTQFRRFSGRRRESSAYLIESSPCKDSDLLACVEIIAHPNATVFEDAHCGALRADTLGRRNAAHDGCW